MERRAGRWVGQKDLKAAGREVVKDRFGRRVGVWISRGNWIACRRTGRVTLIDREPRADPAALNPAQEKDQTLVSFQQEGAGVLGRDLPVAVPVMARKARGRGRGKSRP